MWAEGTYRAAQPRGQLRIDVFWNLERPATTSLCILCRAFRARSNKVSEMSPSQSPIDPERTFHFIAAQLEENRKQFNLWFRILTFVVTIMFGVAVWLFYYFGGRSVEDAKQTFAAELRRRIDDEFKTDRIRGTITTVVKERTSAELTAIMNAEVSRQVAAELERRKHLIDEQIRAEIEKFQSARMLPRHIPIDKLQATLDILKTAPSDNALYIDVFEGSGSESYTYADEYVKLFRSAGWKSAKLRVRTLEPMRRYMDLTLLVRDPATNRWVEPIKIAFVKVWGYGIPVMKDESLGDNEARMVVPLRPL